MIGLGIVASLMLFAALIFLFCGWEEKIEDWFIILNGNCVQHIKYIREKPCLQLKSGISNLVKVEMTLWREKQLVKLMVSLNYTLESIYLKISAYLALFLARSYSNSVCS